MADIACGRTQVDFCIVGAEAVCESGGLVNYVRAHSNMSTA